MVAFVDDIPTAGEAKAIETLTAMIVAKQKREHTAGSLARRDQHAKSHGTYKAKFRILTNLSPAFQVGLFAQPAEFDALVRFSNGAGGVDTFDALPNVRGAAIKVLGVPGKKSLPGEEDSTEHDFLLANNQTFFASSIEELVLLGQGEKAELLLRHPSFFINLLKATAKPVHSPLALDYYSQVPYKFGQFAGKWILKSVDHEGGLPLPNLSDRDFMRHAAAGTLRRRSWRFLFGVQLQRWGRGRGGESLSDSTVAWKGPFVPLAELIIERRREPALESDGEALSFNPWRVLSEHEPLSWVGRTRKAAYVADFQWRTQVNQRP